MNLTFGLIKWSRFKDELYYIHYNFYIVYHTRIRSKKTSDVLFFLNFKIDPRL